MAVGKRRLIAHQAALVWAERGAPAVERYIETGSFGEGGSPAVPYDADVVRQMVHSGKLT